ncbi:MAG: MarR family winged helix-turn-helix transcriptional regulator [Candidatus Limnocylindrales bacterium]
MPEDEIDHIVAQWNAERPDVDVSVTHVLQRITRLYLLQSRSFADVFARHGLSFGEYLVLAALRRAGPPYRMNPTALFHALILSSGAMTNRLDRLEAMGLVERQPDPDDRRGRLVALTPRGREVVDAALLDHITNEEWLLAGLTVGDRAALAGLLRKLLTSEPFRALDPSPLAGGEPDPPTQRRRRAHDSDALTSTSMGPNAAATLVRG